MRFLFVLLILLLTAAPVLAGDPREGQVVQTIDLPIVDRDHEGLMAIIGVRTPFPGSDLVGEGSAADVAQVGAMLSKEEGKIEPTGSYPGAAWRIVVRLDNGVLVSVLQRRGGGHVFVDQRVRIEGGGRMARVVGIKPAS
jgi:hypothetical protein